MSDVKQQPWWRRSVTVTPGAAALMGIAVGSAIGGLVAFPWFGLVSFILWLVLALQGALWGYIFWLKSDRARGERFERTTSWVALVAVAALLLAFPDFWWQMWRDNPSLTVRLCGGICGTAMLLVGTGWGLIHLAGHIRALLRGAAKASLTCSSGGVWDRELDNSPGGQAHRVIHS